MVVRDGPSLLGARWAAEARKKVEVEEDDEAEPMVVAKPPPAAKDTTTMAAPAAPKPAVVVVVDEDAHLPVRERVLKLATTLETAREVENWRLVFESLKVGSGQSAWPAGWGGLSEPGRGVGGDVYLRLGG